MGEVGKNFPQKCWSSDLANSQLKQKSIVNRKSSVNIIVQSYLFLLFVFYDIAD